MSALLGLILAMGCRAEPFLPEEVEKTRRESGVKGLRFGGFMGVGVQGLGGCMGLEVRGLGFRGVYGFRG